jgi:cytochrome c oxidase subunit 3
MDAPSNHLADPSDATVGRPQQSGFGGATTGKIGLWVFLATDTMSFGSLLLAYAVLRARSVSWPDPATRTDRTLAAALTFVLLISGATMSAAVVAARQGRRGFARVLIVLTALAGLAFLAGQAAEYHALLTVRHIGLTADHASATFTLITTYHGLHVLVGVLLLAVIASKPGIWRDPNHVQDEVANAHPPADAAGILEVASLYWQFVDLVWIVIFTVLYLLPPVIHG